jgi:hypothetical protein
MISEMRRKLDISADLQNSDGFVSLILSLHGRIFNEMVYSLSSICQSTKMKASDIIPKETVEIFLNLLEGKNPLNGGPRSDVKYDLEGVKKYYAENIDELRGNIEALPK